NIVGASVSSRINSLSFIKLDLHFLNEPAGVTLNGLAPLGLPVLGAANKNAFPGAGNGDKRQPPFFLQVSFHPDVFLEGRQEHDVKLAAFGGMNHAGVSEVNAWPAPPRARASGGWAVSSARERGRAAGSRVAARWRLARNYLGYRYRAVTPKVEEVGGC